MRKRKNLKIYKRFVGKEAIKRIYEDAAPLVGKHILHINSTFLGGGVAELLNTIVPLMNKLGIITGWRVLHGTPDFFSVTKAFHNALQGGEIRFTEMKRRVYLQCNEQFSTYTHIDHNAVIVHDPQPLALIKFYRKTQPWLWRCHVDISAPNPEVWRFLRTFISKYDGVIVSSPRYKKKDLGMPQHVIYPAIDPFTTKNQEISKKVIEKYLSKFEIEADKPIIAQISRFDRFKDPIGVIKIFERVRKRVDCQLVLAGEYALDDPEGPAIFETLRKSVEGKKDIKLVVGGPDIFVNALQRAASVIVQKSLREGFGLTVTEAMWKGTPVVASNTGGIPLQITHGKNGFLVHPRDISGFATHVRKLLEDEELARRIGRNAKETVRKKFLTPRLLWEWVCLLRGYLVHYKV